MEIFKLFGSVFVDTDKANKNIGDTGKHADGLGTKMINGAKTVGKWGLALGTAAAGAATALYGVATKSAEATDRIDKLSQKIGMSRESFQEWDFICSQSGMSVEQLQGGFKTLTAQMDKVTEGNKSATEMFTKLGISVTDSTGKLKSQEQVFEEAVTALQGMEDGTEKARLATELFGKSGSELMPLLNGAAGSVEDMKNMAHELGLVLEDEAIDSGVAFTDAVDQMKRSLGAVVTQIGVSVMPVVTQLVDYIKEYMPQIQAVISAVFGVITKVVEVAIEVVSTFIGWIKNLVDEARKDGSELNNIWEAVKEMFFSVFNALSELISSFVGFCNELWERFGDDIIKCFGYAWDNIKIIFQVAVDALVLILNIFSALFSGDWNRLWESVKELVSVIWEGIKSLVSNTLTGILDILSSFIPNMLQAGKDLFMSLWDGIKDIWNDISRWVSDKVSWLVDKVSFWKKSSNEMDTYTTGSVNTYSLNTYTADQPTVMRTGAVSTQNVNITVNATVRNQSDIDSISRKLQSDFSKYNRALGTV